MVNVLSNKLQHCTHAFPLPASLEKMMFPAKKDFYFWCNESCV